MVRRDLQRRRRRSAAEKTRLVAAMYEPGAVATEIARSAGVEASLLYRWRRDFGAVRKTQAVVPVRMAVAPEVSDDCSGSAPGLRAAVAVIAGAVARHRPHQPAPGCISEAYCRLDRPKSRTGRSRSVRGPGGPPTPSGVRFDMRFTYRGGPTALSEAVHYAGPGMSPCSHLSEAEGCAGPAE